MALSSFNQRYSTSDNQTTGAFAFDVIGGYDYAISKVAYGALGSVTHVDASNPLPVTGVVTGTALTRLTDIETNTDSGSVVGNGAAATAQRVTLASDGTGVVAATQSGTWTVTGAGGTFPVTDSGGSLTVDAPVATPVFVRLSDGSAAITTLPVSVAQDVMLGTDFSDVFGTASLLTTTQADDLANTTDTLNTSALLYVFDGTTWDRLKGNSTDGMLVNLGTNNDVTVTGSVTANAGTNLNTSALALETTATSIKTAVEIIDNAISGSEMQVDVVAALPAGTNAIGKLAANSGVDIGDVDVTSVIPGTGATNLGKAIDTATGATDTGVLALATRDDALSALTPIEGDNVQLRVDANGALWVIPSGTITVASHAVTNAGTFAVQVDGAALTALQLIDDAIVADDAIFTPATTKVMMAGFEYDDITPDAVNEGDAGAGRMSANRCQYVNIRDNAGNERGLNIDASGQLAVTIASGQTLATVTTVSTVTTCSTVTTVSTLTGGGVAHDSADSGNPHKVGARCALTLSDDTMVANADRTDNVSDGDAALIVRPQFPLADLISERVSNTDGASTAFTNFGATANARNVITSIVAWNSSATNGYIDFRDGTAGAILFTVPIPATGGVVLPAGATPYFKTTANTALAFDVSGALSTVYISVSGFKSKVV